MCILQNINFILCIHVGMALLQVCFALFLKNVTINDVMMNDNMMRMIVLT